MVGRLSVRSSSYNADGTFTDIRYIGVKGCAHSGAIRGVVMIGLA